MAIQTAQLRISTPTEPVPPGRGFYQLEEDALYVQIGLFSLRRRFFAWLEADELRLDLDREGRLIFIEVNRPRRHWPVDDDMVVPTEAEVADIRWLDFRQRLGGISLTTDHRRTLLRIGFGGLQPLRNLYLGEKVVLQAGDQDRLAAIWVLDVVDDLAGREIKDYRRFCRREANRTV